VIDDDNFTGATVMDVCEEHKITAWHVDSAQKAVDILNTRVVDIILTDYYMPNFDVIAFLEMISLRKPATPVVVMSLDMMEGNIIRPCLTVNPTCEFIPKPVYANDIIGLRVNWLAFRIRSQTLQTFNNARLTPNVLVAEGCATCDNTTVILNVVPQAQNPENKFNPEAMSPVCGATLTHSIFPVFWVSLHGEGGCLRATKYKTMNIFIRRDEPGIEDADGGSSTARLPWAGEPERNICPNYAIKPGRYAFVKIDGEKRFRINGTTDTSMQAFLAEKGECVCCAGCFMIGPNNEISSWTLCSSDFPSQDETAAAVHLIGLPMSLFWRSVSAEEAMKCANTAKVYDKQTGTWLVKAVSFPHQQFQRQKAHARHLRNLWTKENATMCRMQMKIGGATPEALSSTTDVRMSSVPSNAVFANILPRVALVGIITYLDVKSMGAIDNCAKAFSGVLSGHATSMTELGAAHLATHLARVRCAVISLSRFPIRTVSSFLSRIILLSIGAWPVFSN
jgi:CheY-like chemotaxis protein